MKRNANYRRRYPKNRKTRKSSRRPRISRAVKSYVKKTIHRMAENKVVNWTYNGNLLPFNASASQWLAYNVMGLYPNSSSLTISQGVGEGQRIGDKISIRKGMLKFVITQNTYNASTNSSPMPYDIRIMIGYNKQNPVTGPDFSAFSELFQNGNSFSAPTSNLYDMIQQPNKDSWGIVYDKVVKVGPALGYNTTFNQGFQLMPNNDYKYSCIRKINITKYLAKSYGFNDTNNNPKTGKALYVWFLYAPAVGVTASSTEQPLKIFTAVDLEYEDL